jgi:hypothetical protein
MHNRFEDINPGDLEHCLRRYYQAYYSELRERTSRDTTENQQRVLERRNARLQDITIMTYDDLLDKARQHLENLRQLVQEA